MNRDLSAAAAPRWIEIKAFPAQTMLDLLAMWTEAVIDAIDLDHLEPDTWEAMYLTYSPHALVEGRYFAALEFTGMVLTAPYAASASAAAAWRPASGHAGQPA